MLALFLASKLGCLDQCTAKTAYLQLCRQSSPIPTSASSTYCLSNADEETSDQSRGSQSASSSFPSETAVPDSPNAVLPPVFNAHRSITATTAKVLTTAHHKDNDELQCLPTLGDATPPTGVASCPAGQPKGLLGWSYYTAGAVCSIGLGLTKLWRR